MSEKPQTCLMWEGQSTLAALRKLVAARESFELQLPPDFHFALFRHLYPHAAAGDPEQIDVRGGTELLDRVVDIQGLRELAELITPVAAGHAQVHILSPGPAILVCFPATAQS